MTAIVILMVIYLNKKKDKEIVMNSFYAYLSRMKNIERWALMRNTSKENILEHSAMVGQLAHGIALVANHECNMNVDANKIATEGLFHELSEVITGDLPTPIKYYNQEITSVYKSIEEKATRQIISTLPEQYQESYLDIAILDKDSIEQKIVKCADKLAAYIKCIEERISGNNEFRHAECVIHDDLMKIAENFEPLRLFLDMYLDSFSATLDELK